MINLSKGLTLFVSNDNSELCLSSLTNFLSEEYTVLTFSFGKDKLGLSPTEDDFQEQVKKNLFRVEMLVVLLNYKLNNYTDFFNFLTSLNLIVFIVTPRSKSDILLDNAGSYIKNFYEVKTNPDYLTSNLKRFSNPIASLDFGSISDKYLIRNINTDEEFTVNQYKKSYIRDKKIDIFLNDND
jgi:hypothetical protein